MTPEQAEAYRETTKKMIPYNFPTKRICDGCKEAKGRTSGVWLEKHWICHTCLKKGEMK